MDIESIEFINKSHVTSIYHENKFKYNGKKYDSIYECIQSQSKLLSLPDLATDIILQVVLQNKDYKDSLYNFRGNYIVEKSDDIYWGVNKTYKGLNMYGKLLTCVVNETANVGFDYELQM